MIVTTLNAVPEFKIVELLGVIDANGICKIVFNSHDKIITETNNILYDEMIQQAESKGALAILDYNITYSDINGILVISHIGSVAVIEKDYGQ